jgi:Tfp pilus assembly protein FimV
MSAPVVRISERVRRLTPEQKLELARMLIIMGELEAAEETARMAADELKIQRLSSRVIPT